MRTTLRFLAIAILIGIAPTSSLALDRFINQGPAKLVIGGYDATAYFKRGRAERGTTSHAVRWMGVTWRFKSADEAAAFRANPAAFAPQFGAYCTGGLAQQHAVYGQPTIWRMHKGKVYLFATENGGRRFDRDPEGVIRAAAAYWKTLPIRQP